MALDAGMVGRTLTAGTAKTIESGGQGMSLSATLRAVLPTRSDGKPRRLTWAGTGNQWWSDPETQDVAADQVVTFTDVPACDSAGWRLDGATWTGDVAFQYVLELTARRGVRRTTTTIGPFVILESDPATIDVDTLIETTTGAGTPISIVDVWSALVADAQAAAQAAEASASAAQTSAATAADLVDQAAAPTETFVASRIGAGGEIDTALSAAIAAEVAEDAADPGGVVRTAASEVAADAIAAEVSRADATYQPVGDYATPETVGAYVTANAPEIAAAAADLAASDAGLVRKTDPGIPRDMPDETAQAAGVALDEATLTADDRLIEGRAGAAKVFSEIVPAHSGASVVGAASTASAETVMSDGSGTYSGAWLRTEHMLDDDGTVPAWVLDRWKARMGTGVSSQAPIDLIIVAGQSNAAKRDALPTALLAEDPAVVEWSGGSWVVETGVPWLGSGVGRGWLLRNPNSGRRVGIVPCAVGSTGFSSTTSAAGHWRHGVAGTGPDLATAMVTKAQAALAAAPDGSAIVGVVWSQGEQDRGLAPATYQGHLDELIGWTRGQLGIAALPWVLGSMTPILAALDPLGGGTSAIEAVLEDTPRRLAQTAYHWGPADGSDTAANGIHWAPETNHERGKAMVDQAWTRALLNRADAGARTPTDLTITRSGDVATITWEHPAARLDHIELETSTDSGATWVIEALAGPAVRKHTKAVATGTPLWARVSAVCTTPAGSTTSTISMEVHA